MVERPGDQTHALLLYSRLYCTVIYQVRARALMSVCRVGCSRGLKVSVVEMGGDAGHG